MLKEKYVKCILARPSFWPRETPESTVVMLNGEEWGVAVVWFAKSVVVLLGLRVGRGGGERETVFVQHLEVTAPLIRCRTPRLNLSKVVYF